MTHSITRLVVLAGIVLVATAAHAAIIDDFTKAPAYISYPDESYGPQTVTHTGIDTDHVMGGQRTMSIDSDVTGMFAMSYAYVDAAAGVVAMATPSTFTADLTILWDGGTMDLVPNGENAIEVTVDEADHAGEMTITLTDTDGSIVAVTKSFSAGSAFTLLFTESDFAEPANEIDPGTDGFDPTMTDSIELVLNGTPAGDYTLGLVQSVPEPATMAFLTLGGLAVLTRRRQR